jgi:calcium permeable stress-gated cation channel
MLFVIVTFCLFYFTYLYNFLFVNGFVTDTGGLAFPKAIYQTFTGIYFAEICLLGIFFITSGARAQGIVMVVVLALTVLYQLKLQDVFDPLITYLPIDIQEELLSQVEAQKVEDGRNPDEEQAQFEGPAPNDAPLEQEKPSISSLQATPVPPATEKFVPESPQTSNAPAPDPDEQLSELDEIPSGNEDHRGRWLNPAAQIRDQFHNISDKLPAISIPGLTKKKTLDDDDDADVDTTLMRKFTHELSPDELTAIAFEHAAMRSRPPILWIPEDELGIAKDEIRRTKVECGKEVSITCRGAKLTEKGKIVFEGNPPDYFHIPSF